MLSLGFGCDCNTFPKGLAKVFSFCAATSVRNFSFCPRNVVSLLRFVYERSVVEQKLCRNPIQLTETNKVEVCKSSRLFSQTKWKTGHKHEEKHVHHNDSQCTVCRRINLCRVVYVYNQSCNNIFILTMGQMTVCNVKGVAWVNPQVIITQLCSSLQPCKAF